MEGLQPVLPIGNNGNCDGWGSGWGALVGGAVGGAVGSAWNGNRWNNGNCGGGGCGDQYIMDTLTTMRTDVNSIGRDNLLQTSGVQSAMCQGFGGINASVERVGAQLAQGQCRTEAAVLTTGLQGQIQQKDNTIFQLNSSHAAEVQGMRNTYDLKSSIDGCCCETNRNIERQGCQTREVLLAEGCATRTAIHTEGEATRAMIAKLEREQLLRENAAQAAKIGQLESQQFSSALVAGQSQVLRNDMQGMLNTIINHMSYKATATTGGTTPAS